MRQVLFAGIIMVTMREPDDLCPWCGVPVPKARRGPTCPYCGGDFDTPPEASQGRVHLSPFGHGLCGFIAGSHLGVAVALMAPDIQFGDPRLVVFPTVGGIAGATLARVVTVRLRPQVRRGFEVFLFATMAAAFGVMCLAIVGVTSLDALAIVGAVIWGASLRMLGRVLYTDGRARR